MMKVVVNVEMSDSKIKKKVLQAVSGLSGIVSIEADRTENKITVIGTSDPVEIVDKLRNIRPSAYIITMGTEPAEKVEEPAEKVIEEPAQAEPTEIEQIDWAKAYPPFPYYPTTNYYCYPCQEPYNPNPCVIS